MSPTSPEPARGWSVDPTYFDARGHRREVDPAIRRAIEIAIEAAGQPTGTGAGGPTPLVTGPDERAQVGAGTRLVLEDGSEETTGDRLPPGLPFGYHRLDPPDGGPGRRLIVSPGRCHRPDWFPAWGWSVQLYALRSGRSWGVGDLADLRRLGRLAADQGAAVVLVNPLHATAPVPPVKPSPYSPSSRRYLSPLWLGIDEVPGRHGPAGIELDGLAETATSLNHERLIARDPALRLKLHALENLWERFDGDADFDRFLEERGDELTTYSAFCVLAEHLGPDWRTWPTELRHPASPAVDERGRRHPRSRLHAWTQWLTDRQLGAAAAQIGLIQDLPVGFDAGGADAWEYQDLIVDGYAVGAPPDLFNPDGQDWGLPVFSPPALAAAGYEPWVQTIRASLRHAAGLRIDHVMGLFRQWWVPAGGSPADGAYVRFPADDLLDVLALESQRAGAFVVGEDLGTVEDRVRVELARRDVMSYRLLWFEDQPPPAWPAGSLAAVSTHDLPTVAGVWTGADAEEQRALGVDVDEGAMAGLRERLLPDDLPEPTSLEDAVDRAHQLLAGAGSQLAAVSLDDALGVAERPNIPGLDDRRPNWCLALPVALEALEADPRVRRVAEIMRSRARPRPD